MKKTENTIVTVNVLVVTKEITTYAELKEAVSHEVNQAKYGYYRLKTNIAQSLINDAVNGDWKSDGSYGFRGTLDGNNCSITGTFGTSGLIGTVGNGAVIKNITITQSEYVATRMIFGNSMIGATIQNVVINVKGSGSAAIPSTTGGLISGIFSYSSKLINVTINSQTTAIDSLFGTGSYYSYPADYIPNTFDGCTINAKSLAGIAKVNGTVLTYNDVSGLTVNLSA